MTGYKRADGSELEFGQWHNLAPDFSVMPMKVAPHKVRHDPSGETHKPPWRHSAQNDTIDYWLYNNRFDDRVKGLLQYYYGPNIV